MLNTTNINKAQIIEHKKKAFGIFKLFSMEIQILV